MQLIIRKKGSNYLVVSFFLLPILKGENIKEAYIHNVVAWGKTAQIIEKFVTKGKEVAVEGKLTSRSYETKEGEKKYITEVVCNELLLLGNK